MKDFIAYLAAILAIVSVIPYLIDIIKKRTKPNIVSWSTWTLLTMIATIATFSAGEYRAALLLLGSTTSTLLVVLLGLKYGIAKLALFDVFCWLAALGGIILWQAFDSPTIAIIITVATDCLGVLPTIRHAWSSPKEETWQTFVVGAVAALLTFLSLETFNINNVLYPGYLVIANSIIVITVVFRRRQKGIPLSRSSIHETLHN